MTVPSSSPRAFGRAVHDDYVGLPFGAVQPLLRRAWERVSGGAEAWEAVVAEVRQGWDEVGGDGFTPPPDGSVVPRVRKV